MSEEKPPATPEEALERLLADRQFYEEGLRVAAKLESQLPPARRLFT